MKNKTTLIKIVEVSTIYQDLTWVFSWNNFPSQTETECGQLTDWGSCLWMTSIAAFYGQTPLSRWALPTSNPAARTIISNLLQTNRKVFGTFSSLNVYEPASKTITGYSLHYSNILSPLCVQIPALNSGIHWGMWTADKKIAQYTNKQYHDMDSQLFRQQLQ